MCARETARTNSHTKSRPCSSLVAAPAGHGAGCGGCGLGQWIHRVVLFVVFLLLASLVGCVFLCIGGVLSHPRDWPRVRVSLRPRPVRVLADDLIMFVVMVMLTCSVRCLVKQRIDASSRGRSQPQLVVHVVDIPRQCRTFEIVVLTFDTVNTLNLEMWTSHLIQQSYSRLRSLALRRELYSSRPCMVLIRSRNF